MVWINFFKGFLIGIANLIPGVSGGTFALILGIYERLIRIIHNLNFKTLKNLFSFAKFKDEFKRIDGIFLVSIASGAFCAIVCLSWVIDYLLKNHPDFTLSFFLGLILPSIAVPYKLIKKKDFRKMLFVLPGILLVVSVYVFTTEAEIKSFSYPLLFLSGFLATSAMILPGISGSFILLLIGVYGAVISNIKTFFSSPEMESFLFLSVFGLGCAAGLAVFARVMKFLFERYKDRTLYFLIGLILGSIVVLWPFKAFPERSAGKMEIGIVSAENRLPQNKSEALFCAGFFAIGMLGAGFLNRIAKTGDN
ncbi:MAG: DUF368 domain-containing protein [bacterium]